MSYYIISWILHAFWLVLTYNLLEDRCIDDVTINNFNLLLYYIKQIDSMLPCVCSVIDHRNHQNVVRTSVTHLAAPRVPLWSITEQTHGNIESFCKLYHAREIETNELSSGCSCKAKSTRSSNISGYLSSRIQCALSEYLLSILFFFIH